MNWKCQHLIGAGKFQMQCSGIHEGCMPRYGIPQTRRFRKLSAREAFPWKEELCPVCTEGRVASSQEAGGPVAVTQPVAARGSLALRFQHWPPRDVLCGPSAFTVEHKVIRMDRTKIR